MASSILIDLNNFKTYIFYPEMGPLQILSLQVKVNLGVIAMKGYSTLPKSPELELHHHFRVILRTPL